MDEILAEFIAETLETLEILSGEVVAWEADPSERTRLDAFFRFFHTVKGSCGFLNLPRFERLAHAAEDVLAAIRRGERAPDAETVTAVLAVMDRIGALARSIGEADQIPEDEDDALLDALQAHDDSFEIFEPLPVAAEPAAAASEDEPESETVAADAAAAPAPAQSARSGNQSRDRAPRTIRLPLALIDQLMNGISDMVLARNDLSRKMRERETDPELESSFERLSANVADLRDMISKTRMQRVDRLYAAIPRMVRDLSRDLGKRVALELDGGDVEMDREMIEMVVDPLTHIVRNALDHGIETPADRARAGKPETGNLRIIARQSGNQIVIEISDDGRGIDRARLVEKAVSAGLVAKDQVKAMSDEEKLHLIFHPGLSTAQAVTAVSGRGVGMDVVRANIEQIGGVIGLESVASRGTTITMRVPLTLTIIPGLIVRSGGHFFAMPRGNVVELLHQNSSMVSVEAVGGARIATIRGERYSLIDIEDVLGLDQAEDHHGPRTLMVVRSSIGQPYVLGVQSVESNEELVIRPASPLVTSAGVYAGMTLPDNGQPMLLLDAAGIAQCARLPLRETTRSVHLGTAGAGAREVEQVQALVFEERDGARRLMPLSIVDRVEDVPASQIAISNGAAFARIDGRLLRVLNVQGKETGFLKSLRLHGGSEEICYLINEVLDIVDMSAQLDVRIGMGRIAGLAMVGESQLEVIDPFALFAEAARGHTGAQAGSAPIRCHIADADDPWMTGILAPLLRQAGYEVTQGSAGDAVAPDIILCTGEAAVCGVRDTPVLTLRSEPDPELDAHGTIYRYDRDRLIASISQVAARSAA